MINKFSKIHKAGIFENFLWNGNTPPKFKTFNAFYGWNGSGKTTISRLLAILESGQNEELDLEDDSTCIIDTSNGNKVISKTVSLEPLKNIRVFNEDFIRDSLKWDRHQALPILIVGKDKIGKKEELDKARKQKGKEETALPFVKENLTQAAKEKEKLLDKIREDIKRDLASIEDVKPEGTGANLYRNYNVGSAESLLSKAGMVFPTLTQEEMLEKKKALAEKEEMDKIDDLVVDVRWYDSLLEKAKDIFGTSISGKVASSISEEMVGNFELESWIETGHSLHKGEPRPLICKFCKNEIPETRMEELDRYFDEARRTLATNISSALVLIEKNLVGTPENTEKFYKEFEKSITKARDNFFCGEAAIPAKRRSTEKQSNKQKEKSF